MMADAVDGEPGRMRLSLCGLCVFLLCAAACGKPTERPIMPPDVTDFATLFRENCSGCHGIDGKNGPGRPLNNALYLSLIPRDTLQHTIENGIPGTAMPAWARSQGGPLYPKQVTALVNGMEQNWAKPIRLGKATLPPYSAENDPADPRHGKKLFVRDCFMCHGKGAKVGPISDPAFLALVSNQGLRTSVIIGRPDLGMPDWRSLSLGHAMSDQDISDVVAYLASLRPQDLQTSETGNQRSGGKGVGNAHTKQ